MHKFVKSLIVLVVAVTLGIAAQDVFARGMGGGQSCDQNAQANSQPAQPVASSATAADATTQVAPLSPQQIAATRVDSHQVAVDTANVELARCRKCKKDSQKQTATAAVQPSQALQFAQGVQASPKVNVNQTTVIKPTRDGLLGRLFGLDKPSVNTTAKTVIRTPN